MAKKRKKSVEVASNTEIMGRSMRLQTTLHLALIVLLVAVIYSNTLQGPFVFDDMQYIIKNPFVKAYTYFTDKALVDKAVAEHRVDANVRTRVVALLTFAWNYSVHGFTVKGFHIVNISIHAVTGILVYWLVILLYRTPFILERRVMPGRGRIAALFASLLFISHPVQTQAVTYVTQRFTSLATMFYLLCLVMYAQARLADDVRLDSEGIGSFCKARTAIPYGIALLSAVLAMKTKEISFTLPIMIVLFELMFFEGSKRARLLFLLPFLATLAMIPLTVLQDGTSRTDIAAFTRSVSGHGPDNPVLTYLFTQFRVVVTYLRLLVLPVGQNLDYDYPAYSRFFAPAVVSSFLFLLTIVGSAIVLCRRSCAEQSFRGAWYRMAAFGIFWFFLALSVESTILPLEDFIFEHRLYLPSIGVFLTVIAGAELLKDRLVGSGARWVSAVLIITIASWSAAAYARNAVWGDVAALWKDASRKSPGKARPYIGVGDAYLAQGMYQEAVLEYESALKVDPRNLVAYQQLGYVYYRQGDFEAAMQVLQQAVQIKGNDAELHNSIGSVYEKMNHMREAEDEYRTAIRLRPNLAEAHRNLGTLLLKLGRSKEAVDSFTEAVSIAPFNDDLLLRLGMAQEAAGDRAAAGAAFERALAANPSNFQARVSLDMLNARMKKGGGMRGE